VGAGMTLIDWTRDLAHTFDTLDPRGVKPVPLDAIVVRGAREHNLKNIDVTIPRDRLVVITGVSGSGKSSLAFDTIYAEGQRRYVESLSAYARQFLGQMEKPDVDYIEGLSPAISIDQKGASRNPRSTVGTVTEIYDYLRLLFARAGVPTCPTATCPNFGRPIERQTVQQMVDAILAIPPGRRLMILGPVVKDRKGEHEKVFEDARRAGFVRVRVDGRVHDLDDDIKLNKNQRHTIEVVVDRLLTEAEEERDPGLATRLTDSVETALKLGGGTMLVWVEGAAGTPDETRLFSEHAACPRCGTSLGEIAPRNFSFNSPHGACPTCTGLGIKMELDPDLIIPNKNLSLAEGAIAPWSRAAATNTWYGKILEAVAEHYGFSMTAPVRELAPEHLELVLYGNGRRPVTVRYTNQYGRTHTYDTTYEGIIPNLERRYRETESDYMRQEIERYMAARPCPACHGRRLKPETLAVKVAGRTIVDVTRLSVTEALRLVEELAGPDSPLTERQQAIAYQVLKEIRARLTFLVDVGLDYLTLDRAAATLSGGEAQRIRLATQIGSSLMGVLYVCDEPSIGLHPVDDARLIRTLERLRDLGNTVLIVEHDESMMRAADWIIDMGPGAGEQGGRIVVAGPIETIMACPESITGAYLAGRREIPVPSLRRPGNGLAITVRGARENNLKGIDVSIPLGKFVCVTGVSGSGKSTLVEDILYKKVAQLLYNAKDRPGACDAIEGLEHVDKVVDIDQSPIGRTPRSNPATYTGAFGPIRELFASVPEARARGYTAGRFSFNVKGGRCEACRGEGYIEIQMQFLPDVTVPCEVCKGSRYNREALEIHFKGKTIADVLAMTVSEALEFFRAHTAVRNKLETLRDVGLGYIRLGQPATTLSGGEAQRVKLATELSRRATGRTLYILDEPTTGLSFEDVAHLLAVLQRLVDAGNTVLVIEHNLDVIKCADHIIDLGPLGGDRGGELVAEGTPEQVATMAHSFTGRYLQPLLARHAARRAVAAAGD
jgi:excinuclease ABC subunit A